MKETTRIIRLINSELTGESDRRKIIDLLLEALARLGVVVVYVNDLDERRATDPNADAILPRWN